MFSRGNPAEKSRWLLNVKKKIKKIVVMGGGCKHSSTITPPARHSFQEKKYCNMSVSSYPLRGEDSKNKLVSSSRMLCIAHLHYLQ